jgi:hypothetical protein
MAKEVIGNKDIAKKPSLSKDEIQLALVDNFISLQKVMSSLSVKFDELSTNMSRLLQLFEISAKTFAEKYSGDAPAPANMIDAEYIGKLDTLLEQNKIISKGIMLIEEKLREKTAYEQIQEGQMNYPQMQKQSNLPSMQQPESTIPYKKEIGARQDPKQLPKY